MQAVDVTGPVAAGRTFTPACTQTVTDSDPQGHIKVTPLRVNLAEQNASPLQGAATW